MSTRLEEISSKPDGLEDKLTLQPVRKNVTRIFNAVVLNGTTVDGTDPSATCYSLDGEETRLLVDKPRDADGKMLNASSRMTARLPIELL